MSEQSLSFHEIAKHWRRSIRQRPTYKEVFDVLLRAIWLNMLSIQITSKVSDQREPLLRITNIARNQPGIVFYEWEADLHPEIKELADGGVEVDICKRVYLPNDESSWKPEIMANAFASLASCTFDDYEPDPVRIALEMVEIRREAFAAFCDAQGYPRPDFWFSVKEQKKAAKLPSFPGRPSVMAPIVAEFHRRLTAGEAESKVRDEARALRQWAKDHINASQLPGMLAIENTIRADHKKFRGKHPNP